MDWKALLPGAYLALFVGAMFGFAWWRRKQHKRRAPFKRETRVLRQPGESLRRRIAKMDEDFLAFLCLASLVPLTVMWLGLRMAAMLPPGSAWIAVIGSLVLFAGIFALAAKWAAAKLLRRCDHELGLYGERVVGDALAVLERHGWRIFHDFPREARGKKFNIDHIAVGPGGVFAIETKSPRKGDARPGTEDHVVIYNGEMLSWPWGDDRLGIDQAIENANWLGTWLTDRTLLKLRVEAVLTFPDWFVREQRAGPVRVLNSTLLPRVLAARTSVLGAEQVALIAAQIEGICRDVDYVTHGA